MSILKRNKPDNKDDLESLLDDIEVNEISPDDLKLPSSPCRIVRWMDKYLTLPTGGVGSKPEVNVYGDLLQPPEGRQVLVNTLRELLDEMDRRSINLIRPQDLMILNTPFTTKLEREPKIRFEQGVMDGLIKKMFHTSYANLTVADVRAEAMKKGLLDEPVNNPPGAKAFLTYDGRYLLGEPYYGRNDFYKIVDSSNGPLKPEEWEKESDPLKLKELRDKNSMLFGRQGGLDRLERLEEVNGLDLVLTWGLSEKSSEYVLVILDMKEATYGKMMGKMAEKVSTGVGFVQDPHFPGRVYMSQKNRDDIKVVEIERQGSSVKKKERKLSLSMDKSHRNVMSVQRLVIDDNSNFLVCTYCVQPGEIYAGVFSKETGREIRDLGECGNVDPVVTHKGDIVFQGSAGGTSRAFRTNMNKFDENLIESARLEKKRLEKLDSLGDQSSADVLKGFETLGEQQEKVRDGVGDVLEPDEEPEDPRIAKVKKNIAEIFEPQIRNSKGNLDGLKEVQKKMILLKEGKVPGSEAYGEFPDLFQEMEELLEEIREEAILSDLRGKLIELKGRVGNVEEFGEMKDLEEEFLKAMRQRRRIKQDFNGEEKEAHKALEDLKDRIKTKEKEIKAELINRLERQWVAVETAFDEIETLEGLESSHDLVEVKRLEELFELLDDTDVLREWRKRLISLRKDKRDEIKRREQEEANREQQKVRDLIDRISEDIGFIDDELDAIEDISGVDQYYEKSPLVGRVKERVTELEDGLKKDLWGRLKRVFHDRKNEIKMKTEFEDKAGKNAFGFPIFEAEVPRVEVVVKPLARKSTLGKLVFKDNYGHEWSPAIGAVPVDPNDEETREMIDLYREDAGYELLGVSAEKVRALVPELGKEWVISKHTEQNLCEMGRLLNKQMRRQNGILIMEGEAGTGKNVLVDMLGHFCNREVFEFSCNFQTEKEDIQHSFEYDPDRGTYKVPSSVIKALQTPGAIVAFDEINTLPPGVSKMLNSLFDHRRCIILPDGTRIKAHPSVVIVGLMNPQNYIGTKPLPQEILSRARMIKMGYPKEAVEEGLMYMRLLESTKDFSVEEFRALWAKIIDGTDSEMADKVDSDNRKIDIERMNRMIKIGQEMRKLYADTQKGTIAAGDEVNFIFSLRDGGQVVEEMEDDVDLAAKDAIKAVVIPKIGDPEEEETMQTFLRAA